MKRGVSIIAMAIGTTAVAFPAAGQTYEVTWYTIDGGGVMNASGGAYEAGGTIGQPDAGELSGGDYAVTGGFWSMGRGCSVASAPEPERLDLEFTPVSQKIRYLSFSAGEAGRSQAVRVTFSNVPSPYDHWNDVKLWVQQPKVYCENAGAVQEMPCPTQVGGLPNTEFLGVTLGCEPYWDDWAQYNLVHVWNEGIIPGGAYNIQVIDSTCSTAIEGDYSTALALTQSAWADAVKDCSTTPCGPPDGSTGIVDVTAILDKYKNLPGNVIKARADIEGSPAGDARLPDQAINITDVTFCLGAFLGETYPPPGFPLPGNPPECR